MGHVAPKSGHVNSYVALCLGGGAIKVSIRRRYSTHLLIFVVISFWIFLALSIYWSFQINCVLQIVANRVSFLISQPRNVRILKFGILAITVTMNLTVSPTWIPGELQITETVVAFNKMWDRTTKAVFSAVDLVLNFIFLRLVWQKLISEGLAKYWALFRFNCCLITLSVLLDVCLIALESAASAKLYLCFNPLVFLGKLHIELSMADMLARIVRSANALNILPTNNTVMNEEQFQQVTTIIRGGGSWDQGRQQGPSGRGNGNGRTAYCMTPAVSRPD